MSRVKRGIQHNKRRKAILKDAKGFKWGRKSKIKLAKTAVTKAGAHAYRDRKVKKRTARRVQNVNISATLMPFDISYSKFMGMLKKAKIELNRKMLIDLAINHPNAFKKIVNKVK